jgi:hypothetical protein
MPGLRIPLVSHTPDHAEISLPFPPDEGLELLDLGLLALHASTLSLFHCRGERIGRFGVRAIK